MFKLNNYTEMKKNWPVKTALIDEQNSIDSADKEIN